MKAYQAKYVDMHSEYYEHVYEVVIAENEIYAKTFLDARLGLDSNELCVSFKEISFEKVYIKEITAGDLLRLINK